MPLIPYMIDAPEGNGKAGQLQFKHACLNIKT